MKFENVYASYSGKEALKGISFSLSKRRFTALIGRNGCGKSTLVGCLNGQTRYCGEIKIDDKDILKIKPVDKAKRICVLPQLLPETPFTVLELVMLGRKPHMRFAFGASDEDQLKASEAIECVKLEGYEERAVNKLSGGERQRAFLAMAIAQDAEIIVLDEATTFMDAAFEEETYRILRTLVNERGKTVLSVMHNLSRAVNEADEILVMSNGRLIAHKSAAAIAESDIIEKEFAVKKAKCDVDGCERIVFI